MLHGPSVKNADQPEKPEVVLTMHLILQESGVLCFTFLRFGALIRDPLLPALDQIIDMGHPLVQLPALIDWNILDDPLQFGVPNSADAARACRPVLSWACSF